MWCIIEYYMGLYLFSHVCVFAYGINSDLRVHTHTYALWPFNYREVSVKSQAVY